MQTVIIEELRQKIEVLKGGGKKPVSFVKANKHREKRKHPHKMWRKPAAEQNGAREKATPTQIERPELDRCLDCKYTLSGNIRARPRGHKSVVAQPHHNQSKPVLIGGSMSYQ